MRKLGCILALFPTLLAANLPSSSISSERASYDGNTLMLKGTVHLQHMLGILESGSARLAKDDKEGPFSTIFLKDNVLITLKNRGKISCEEAYFDFTERKGTLKPRKGESILFSRLDARDLMLSSKTAEIEFSNEYEGSIEVDRIKARDTVRVKFQKDLYLNADYAIFQRGEIPVITAFENCLITHNNDQIEAKKVKIFPSTSQVLLSHPKGNLAGSSVSQRIGFSCKKLIWDHPAEHLTLKGDIAIFEDNIGDIVCDEELVLYHKKDGDNRLISSLTARGKTTLNCQLSDQKTHLLICSGNLRLDHERFVLTLESAPNEPIEYYQNNLKLEANQAKLDYTEHNGHLQPKKLVLTGHVLLKENATGSRCALADQFLYYPEEEKMVLSSSSNNNVLFWDATQDLSISAKEVHIVHSDKGENIKGIGNVRFAFSSTENALLQKLFPFYKPRSSGNP